MGRLLAQRLRCRFLDTGAMYRAVTWAAIERGVDPEDDVALSVLAEALEIRLVGAEAGDRLTVDGRDVTDHLRDTKVEQEVSPDRTSVV